MENLQSVANMQRCIEQFEKYMLVSHELDISRAFPNINPRRVIYNTMTEVKEDPEFRLLPLKTLNNITLNKMRDFFLQKLKMDRSSSELSHKNQNRPNPRILDRENQLYGNRPMINTDGLPMPINTNHFESADPFALNEKQKVPSKFNHLTNQRKQETMNDKNKGVLNFSQIQEDKMGLDDFQHRLSLIKEERDAIEELHEFKGFNNNEKDERVERVAANEEQDKSMNRNNMYELFEQGEFTDLNSLKAKPKIDIKGDGRTYDPSLDSADKIVIKRNSYIPSIDSADNIVTKTTFDGFYKQPAPKYEDERVYNISKPESSYLSPYFYVTLNGYDRDWVKNRSRFKFTIETSDLKKTYRNISELGFTKLIIPVEVFDTRSIHNPIPKVNYTHNFKLAVPYVLLMVDEMNDVCDGVNLPNQQAFTHFIHDCTFNAENGRGYHILKPMQDEKKVFHPTLLAKLPKLSLTIAKPNGLPFNNSKDNYYIWKIEYPEYNRPYLKVVLDKFFDKNEFYKGDSIFIQNFMIPVYDKELERANEAAGIPSSDPSYLEYLENSYTFNRIMEFMNRREGHDILEIGKANPEGYSRSFMIHAPGTYDAENGKFVIDKQMVDLIKQHNSSQAHCEDAPTTGTPIKSGDLINMSLQVVVSMQFKTLLGGAKNITKQDII